MVSYDLLSIVHTHDIMVSESDGKEGSSWVRTSVMVWRNHKLRLACDHAYTTRLI